MRTSISAKRSCDIQHGGRCRRAHFLRTTLLDRHTNSTQRPQLRRMAHSSRRLHHR